MVVLTLVICIASNGLCETAKQEMTNTEAIKTLDTWKAKAKNPYAVYDARHGTNSYDAYMFDQKVREEAEQSDADIATKIKKEQSNH